jgi:myo-inositol-1(or 4)-monophosphatase
VARDDTEAGGGAADDTEAGGGAADDTEAGGGAADDTEAGGGAADDGAADGCAHQGLARGRTEPDDLEFLCVRLAREAAVRVRDSAGHPGRIATKSSDTDLVTAADRAVERWLVEQLARWRPADAVLGEEGGAGGSARGRVRWLLDPIDGTVNFVLGLPYYAVSVAAELDGTVVAGAVCNAATGELFHARLGNGAFGPSGRLGGPRSVRLAEAVIATGFAYDRSLRAAQAEAVARLLPRVANIRRLGSAALDLCGVAAGRLDGYYETGLHAWDFAAGALVASEAGCVLDGAPGGRPGPDLVVAAGPELAAELLLLLGQSGAADLTATG